jgi:hypothetical protein
VPGNSHGSPRAHTRVRHSAATRGAWRAAPLARRPGAECGTDGWGLQNRAGPREESGPRGEKGPRPGHHSTEDAAENWGTGGRDTRSHAHAAVRRAAAGGKHVHGTGTTRRLRQGPDAGGEGLHSLQDAARDLRRSNRPPRHAVARRVWAVGRLHASRGPPPPPPLPLPPLPRRAAASGSPKPNLITRARKRRERLAVTSEATSRAPGCWRVCRAGRGEGGAGARLVEGGGAEWRDPGGRRQQAAAAADARRPPQ